MLTIRQNFLETIRGGTPDRFVNQFEPFAMLWDPYLETNPKPQYGGAPVVNLWGVTNEWKLGTPGMFPLHTPDKVVIKDITHWYDYVKAPSLKFTDEQWAPHIAAAEAVDRSRQFATANMGPGIFEQCHFLGEIQNTLINLYEEPEAMHGLIDYLTDWELELAEVLCEHLHPDAIFHHDDWGTQKSTFMSPDMFGEFLFPAYQKVYGYYKSHGVEIIVHHSDSYAATLVPYMIDLGVDVWQGVLNTNNIPALIEQYGGKMSFMGGIESSVVDVPDWSREKIAAEVKKACDANGRRFFIPNTTQGWLDSVHPGVYETTSEEIEKYSKIVFG